MFWVLSSNANPFLRLKGGSNLILAIIFQVQELETVGRCSRL